MDNFENNNTVRITNIQRFCVYDGPGIRTTVFLKGCRLKCPWCCNPETQSFDFHYYYNERICDNDRYGYDITLGELYDIVQKDRNYYENNGGVTFSGGEPLLQIMEYEPLLERLRKEGFSITFETSLFVDENMIKTALKYYDFIYIDMKVLNKDKCKQYIGGYIDVYLSNLKLFKNQMDKTIIRIPCINDIVLDSANIDMIKTLCDEMKVKRIELLAPHNLGEEKYRNLGRTYYRCIRDDEIIEKVANELKDVVDSVRVINW